VAETLALEVGVALTVNAASEVEAGQADATTGEEEDTEVEFDEAPDATPDEAETPETAAVISAAVASSTSRFWEKIQPSTSSTVSQVFPFPVLSLS